MGLELVKKIYQKPPINPLVNWIFSVQFYCTDGSGLENKFGYTLNNPTDTSSISIKADLPSFETNIVTHKYFGSEKSFPVLRKHGGETNLSFYAYSNIVNNNFIFKNFIKTYKESTVNGHMYFDETAKRAYPHKEFVYPFNQIEVQMYDQTGTNIYSYVFKNCIATKFDEGSVDYESSEIIKYNLGIHYDDWFIYLNDKPDSDD